MDGQTATNPQTGEKVVLRNGQWVPAGAAQPSPQAQPSAPRTQAPQGQRGAFDASAVMPALIKQESGGRAGVLGPMTRYGQAVGLTQMLPGTAREMAQKTGTPWSEELYRGDSPEAAEYQARLGQAYLEEGFQKTGSVEGALMYYHGGPNQRIWGPKTQQYARDVMGRMQSGDGASMPQQQAPVPDVRQTATNPQTGEKMELVDGRWVPIAEQGASPAAGRSPTGYNLPEGVVDYESLTPEALGKLKRGARVLMPADAPGQSRQIVTLARDLSAPDREAIMGEQRQTFGGVQTYTPGMADTLGAFASGAAEQVPFLDEAVTASDAALSGRSFSQSRDEYQAMQQALNNSNRGARNAGGLAGFAAGFALPGAGFVGRGANMAQRAGRAAALGAGYGSLYGAGSAEGGVGERAQGAAIGGALGLASGGLAQAGVDRFAGMATRAAANPSPARRLSREGVQLTPGQMLQATPVVGGMIRGLEDGASSVPFAGSAIQGARNQTTESFNRVAINRALEPIGARLPREMPGGYDAIDFAQRALGNAYDEVLGGVTVQLDQPLYDDLGTILNEAAQSMPEPQVRQLVNILNERVWRGLDDANATISGQRFKEIESQLGTLAREQGRTMDGQALAGSIREAQNAVREMVARQNQPVADRIRAINTGYANLTRTERAAGSIGALNTEGMFTPAQLGNAALGMGGSRSSAGAGRNLMQDLASAGKAVLPSTVGDSGTAARGAVTALIAGGATGALSPALAVPVIATSLAYSRPAQAALNLIYRSTDRPGAVSEGLSQLASLARRNPALVPFYEAALLRSSLSSRSEAQGQRPAARGLFGARRPQMAQQ